MQCMVEAVLKAHITAVLLHLGGLGLLRSVHGILRSPELMQGGCRPGIYQRWSVCVMHRYQGVFQDALHC